MNIGLNPKDESALEFIKEELEYEVPISYRQTNTAPVATLAINSVEIVKDLMNLGVIPNKTNLVHVMPISQILYPNSYIRGYFDGNGSVSLSKVTSSSNKLHKYLTCNFTGNTNQIKSIKNYLFR